MSIQQKNVSKRMALKEEGIKTQASANTIKKSPCSNFI
jgi:hypothetical protein